jgi:hypothetical protein
MLLIGPQFRPRARHRAARDRTAPVPARSSGIMV